MVPDPVGKILDQLHHELSYQLAWGSFIREGNNKITEQGLPQTIKLLKESANGGFYPAWYVLAMFRVYVQEGKMSQRFDSISKSLQKQLLAQAFALGHYVFAMIHFKEPIGRKRWYGYGLIDASPGAVYEWHDKESADTAPMLNDEAVNAGKYWLKQSAELDFESAQRLHELLNKTLTECQNTFLH